MEFSEHLANYSIRSLWYITHIDNLESILTHGILSRNLVIRKSIKKTKDISYQSVQRWRTRFHNFVPLYFKDNTPMFYRMMKEYENEVIILLEIDTVATNCSGIQFSDGNVAAKNTQIFDNPKYLSKLNWGCIDSRSRPSNKDEIREYSSEVLLPKQCNSSYIRIIHTKFLPKKELAEKIVSRFPDLNIKIQSGLMTKGTLKQSSRN